MANAPGFLEFLAEWLAPLGRIDRKRMFSGDAFYANGTVFALVFKDVVYLKCDEESAARFEERGLAAFRPMPDKKSFGYRMAPPEFFEDRDALVDWGRSAIAASLRSATRKKPRKARRSS